MAGFHLAQVNIGRLRAPVDDPIMAGFKNQLAPINALADSSPGFVWRLQTEDGDATAIKPFPDEALMAINMSVWASLEALQQFVYKSGHVGPLRDRKEWFESIDGPISRLVVGEGRPCPDGRRSARSPGPPQAARADRTCLHVPRALSAAGWRTN